MSVELPREEGRGRLMYTIVLIFLIIGPPVGGLLLLGSMVLFGARNFAEAARAAQKIASEVFPIFAFSYLVGGLSAIAAGLVVGIGEAFRGGATWLWALMAGLLAGLGQIVFLFVMDALKREFALRSAVMLLICVASTFVCWAVVRTLYRRNSPPAVTS